GCDRDGSLPIPVDVANLGIPHAAELATEIGFPKQLPRAVGPPEFDHGLGATQCQQPFRSVRHCLMENIAVRVLQRAVSPFSILPGEDPDLPWERLRRPVVILTENG